MFLEMTTQIPATAEIEKSVFHTFLTPGLKEKRRILPESAPDPVPPLAPVLIGEGLYFCSPRLATRFESNAANITKVLAKALSNSEVGNR